MNTIKSFIAVSLITVAFAACNSDPENGKQTGQEDGINTIDSTESQTSDTTAPGAPATLSDSSYQGEHDGQRGK